MEATAMKWYTQIWDITHFTARCCCSLITLNEPCNYQRPRCDITWLDATNNLYNGFPS